MVSFPVFRRVVVQKYALYPGKPGRPGLDIRFPAGATLILGINGLGKTTLVNLLLRLVVGPYDLPASSAEGGLGQVQNRLIKDKNARMFAKRVADARDATASLEFSIGDHTYQVTRRLADLRLLEWTKNGSASEEPSEDSYQAEMANAIGVSSFFDVVLVLRHLVFFMEDRRELVWDPTAQRQLLRLLFVEPKEARQWSALEREIVEADSRARNLAHFLYTEEQAIAVLLANLPTGQEVRAQYEAMRQVLEVERQSKAELEDKIVDAEEMRDKARLNLLRSREAKEQALRAVEQLRFEAVATQFPDASETARYILNHLMAESRCLVCGHLSPSHQRELQHRLETHNCLVCSTALKSRRRSGRATSADIQTLSRTEKALTAADSQVSSHEADLQVATTSLAALVSEADAKNNALEALQREVDALARKLPPDAKEISERQAEINGARVRHREHINRRKAAEGKLKKLIETSTARLRNSQARVRRTFAEFATDFLVEECVLSYQPQAQRLGQAGERIEFPAFSIEMTGAAVSGAVLRSAPDEVSESQREFIDLAFRIALMSIAGRGGSTTIIIDSPETSLDAVFAPRAGRLLAKFSQMGSGEGNRLILTSNLSTTTLIPSVLAPYRNNKQKRARVVNLLELAAPNAAAAQYRSEYMRVFNRILAQR